jgi:hypothetical protein
MTTAIVFRVVPAPVRARGADRLHDPDDLYVEDVWLPVVGPASYVAWRHLARLACRSSGAIISLDALAAATGLGTPRGHQSPLHRTMRRLARFDLAHIEDDRIRVRTALPFVTGRQLARLDPGVQAVHRLHSDGGARTAS